MRSQAKPNDADKDWKLLVYEVFRGEKGRQLLAEWRKDHVNGRTFDSDALKMAYKAGKKDFVTDIEATMEEVSKW